jgi:hypothetical protein
MIAALRARGVNALHHLPWYFPTAEEYKDRLEKHGFVVHQAVLIPRPTHVPTGIGGWLDTFASPVLSANGEQRIAAIRNEITELLRPALCDNSGKWTVDYVRLRFSAGVPD